MHLISYLAVKNVKRLRAVKAVRCKECFIKTLHKQKILTRAPLPILCMLKNII